MSKFRKLIETASILPNSKELMQKITDIFDTLLIELEATHPKFYWETIRELHEAINGPHFDETMANWAVSKMKNEDGTLGGHWTIDDTTSIANSQAVLFDKFNKWDWYYVLNMVYSDYFNVIGTDTNMYVQFAKAWIMDKDAPDGKAFKYFLAMCNA
jgi:hypothetical protein